MFVFLFLKTHPKLFQLLVDILKFQFLYNIIKNRSGHFFIYFFIYIRTRIIFSITPFILFRYLI